VFRAAIGSVFFLNIFSNKTKILDILNDISNISVYARRNLPWFFSLFSRALCHGCYWAFGVHAWRGCQLPRLASLEVDWIFMWAFFRQFNSWFRHLIGFLLSVNSYSVKRNSMPFKDLIFYASNINTCHSCFFFFFSKHETCLLSLEYV